MKTNKELLTSVLKTAQMGQIGIRSALDRAKQPGLRQALTTQLKDYDGLETDVQRLAAARDWTLAELSHALRMMTDRVLRMRLIGGNGDSKIAGMMIQGSTRGMITGLKDLHRTDRPDPDVQALSRRLLDCENAGIGAMQPYL